ncbi:MAG: hypothetical protein RL156_1635, partial [Bacteroidota bacterium]
DTVVVEGDAVDVRVQPQQINFPTILRCDSSSASFRVSNLASQTDVHIRQIRLEGDTTEFAVQQVAPDTIAAGADVVIAVAYKPTAMASAAARVIIIHDGGDADTVNLRAASTTATLQLSASDTTMTARIDDKLLININGIVKSSSAFELDTISVHVQTHPAQARFATERFSSVQNGWTWRIDSMNTTYGFYGSWSGGPQPSYLRLLSLPFDMYLSIDQKNIMSVSGVAANAAACLTIDSGTIIINEAPVCFLGGGAIQLTSPLALQVVARSEFLDVQFSTPTSTPVQCQIVSAVGSILYSTIIPAKAGFNSVSIPLHSLPAGVFFCRIVAENSLTAKGFVHMR